MLQDIKSTSKNSTIYALGNIATKAIGLILIPIYTDPEYLSKADYGVLAVLEATVHLLVGLLSMSMANSLKRWYWDKKYINNQKSIFFTTLVFLIITLIPVIFLLTQNADIFSRLIFSKTTYSYLLKLTICSAGLQIISQHVLTLAKIQSRSGLFTFVQVSNFTLKLGLILWGILLKDRGLEAIWEAYVIGDCFTLLLLLPYVFKNISIHFQKNILLQMLSYGFPLMLATVSTVIMSVTDRYMLNSMSGLENTGIYSLGFRIANTLKIVITTSIISALTPLRMKKMTEPGNKRFYSKSMTYSGFVFAITLLGLSLFSLELIKVITGAKAYWNANGVIPLISFALLFDLLKHNATIGLIITKRTSVMGLLIFLTSVINIGLNLVFIPVWDIYGAGLATLISHIFFFLAISVASQKMYFIPYEWKKIAVMILMLVFFVITGLIISGWNVWLRLSIKIMLFIGFPFILYAFNFYEEIEIKTLKKIWKSYKNPKNWKRIVTQNLGLK